MVTLISILVSVLLICEIVLVKYCQVKKRFMFVFSFFVMLLILTALVITGDVTMAYSG